MKVNKFKKVAVLMGGPSAEREVSLCSGKAVADGLRDAGYEVEETDIRGYELDLPAGIDAVFIALHGEFGEDGGIQELLAQKGIPYTGSGPLASNAAFDKVVSKKVFVENGVPTPDYEVLTDGDERSLSLPVVVKPACQGSSIGVHCVFVEDEWEHALKDTFSYGPNAVVETYIEGRELTVGIVGTEALPVVEIVAPEWYDYGSKYTKGRTDYLVPAPVDDKIAQTCSDVCLQAFHILGCSGFGRVDLRMASDGQVYVLEVNTIPGFTETSLLPKAAGEVGLTFSQLCDRIMKSAACGSTA